MADTEKTHDRAIQEMEGGGVSLRHEYHVNYRSGPVVAPSIHHSPAGSGVQQQVIPEWVEPLHSVCFFALPLAEVTLRTWQKAELLNDIANGGEGTMPAGAVLLLCD